MFEPQNLSRTSHSEQLLDDQPVEITQVCSDMFGHVRTTDTTGGKNQICGFLHDFVDICGCFADICARFILAFSNAFSN